MTKKDLIKWLQRKESKTVETALDVKNKKTDEIREEFYKDLGVDGFVDKVTLIFEKAFTEYEKFYEELDKIEGLRVSKWGYKLGYHDIQRLADKNAIKQSLIEAINYINHPINKQIMGVNTEYQKVKNTYYTVIETVKNLPTAKDGLEYLKKLGFDLSEIQSVEQKKQLPATIAINVDIKYLLLNKKEEDK